MPNDPMGQGHAGKDPNGKSITTETFNEAAKSQGMEPIEAMRETLKQLLVELKSDEESMSLVKQAAQG